MKITLKLFIVLLSCVCWGCDNKEESIDEIMWFIRPPQRYRHVENETTEPVLQWLQGMPSFRNRFDFIESPYSFEEWVKKGQNMKNTEQILIQLSKSYSGIISYNTILEGLYYVCTFNSTSHMIDVVQDDDYDLIQRKSAALILGKIGDPIAVEPLIKLASSITIDDQAKESLSSLKLNIIGALSNIGAPKIIAYLDSEIQNQNWKKNDIEFLQFNREQVNKAGEQFILDWLHRAPFNLDMGNSKNLPPFPSMNKWINQGQKIPGIEQTLINIFNKKSLPDEKLNVLRGLRQVATNLSIPHLKQIIISPGCDSQVRLKAFYVLKNLQSPEALKVLEEIGDIEKEIVF